MKTFQHAIYTSVAFLLTSVMSQAMGNPVVSSDTPAHISRSGPFVNKSEAYEPIVVHSSSSQSGKLNANLMFVAEQLERNATVGVKEKPTVMSTVVDLNDLGVSSPLGRLIGEHMMHQLQVRGWAISDIRLTKDLIINSDGEFSLSRDLNKLRQQYRAANVVTGTYMNTGDGILVTIRIIDLETAAVVSTAQTRIIKDGLISSLVDKPKALPSMKLAQ